ncbi:MAG TPA: CAP domain-containing protein [Thermoanaerobaculia bacterium]|nr:CAP domain-containing protein [Thermoanaerobaculia bacterium]
MRASGTLRAGLALAVALVAVPAAGRAEGAPPAITPASVLDQINVHRERSGLPPLREDFRLRHAAEDRMRDMIELAYWGHRSPEGHSPFVWMRHRGYRHERAGENLAVGFETPELLVSSWMESEGHRENILGGEYVDCGIAVIEGSTTRRTSGTSVVVIFGRERIADPITRRASTDRSRETSEPDRR